MKILETKGLTKNYGKITALKDLNLTVNQGEVMGILGPNGSGKTTTLGIILGVLAPTSGEYFWFGDDSLTNHRRRIGSILETPNFFPYLNADENLEIVRRVKKIPKQSFDEVLSFVKLDHRRSTPFKTYSLGMKQRLAIASTLIGDPDVVIFDEPTNGLDPEGIAEVRSTLKEVASRGKTVIMASHILDEVEKICSHVSIIKNGNLLASGPVGAMLTSDITLELDGPDRDKILAFLKSRNIFKNVVATPTFIECQIPEDSDIAEINRTAINDGLAINHLRARKQRLEDEFLQITKS